MLRYLYVVAAVFYVDRATGQDLSIKRIELDQTKLILHYDLLDTTRGRVYTVNLYSSTDNYINPLNQLTGDRGLEVIPGPHKKIEVDAAAQFGNEFNSKVGFELRAKIYIPFIRLESLESGQSFKRGKPYDITWRGGRPQNVLHFDLYKGDRKVNTFTNIGNTGKYTIIFPQSIKPGSDYRFVITDVKNKDEMVNTGAFSIRRKTPLVFKTLPVIAVGAAVIYLLQPKDDCEGCLPNFPSPEDQ